VRAPRVRGGRSTNWASQTGRKVRAADVRYVLAVGDGGAARVAVGAERVSNQRGTNQSGKKQAPFQIEFAGVVVPNDLRLFSSPIAILTKADEKEHEKWRWIER
jgi:hypothetical protein